MMQPVYTYDPYSLGSTVPLPAPVVSPGGAAVAGTGLPAQMPQFGGIQYVLVTDPMEELNTCTSVIIKQQPELLELIAGCETANRYHVLGVCNGVYKYLFKCQERSSFCQRNCCPSHIREFNMDMYHATSVPLAGNISGKFANLFKPFKCSCLCCNRPIINVTLGADNKYVGKIKHLFSCCDPEFEVYNAQGLKYYIRADCCQCGLLCANNFCGKLSTATFEVFQPGSSNVVSTITKMSAQSFGEVMTDADSYQVSFPAGATAEDKLLLIALGLMIDYQYFETSSSDENGMNRRRYGYGYGYY
jgi:hypothetical protein